MLTQERVKELFDYNRNGWLIRKLDSKWKAAGTKVGSIQKSGYRTGVIDGNNYCMGRVIHLWHKGYMPDTMDHINRRRYDDRIENLRECTPAQNSYNRGKSKGSRYKGVTRKKTKWKAQIRGTHIGTFSSAEEAAFEYNIEAKKLFGEFAFLNVLPRDYVHITER